MVGRRERRRTPPVPSTDYVTYGSGYTPLEGNSWNRTTTSSPLAVLALVLACVPLIATSFLGAALGVVGLLRGRDDPRGGWGVSLAAVVVGVLLGVAVLAALLAGMEAERDRNRGDFGAGTPGVAGALGSAPHA